jgi:hypothetical protein
LKASERGKLLAKIEASKVAVEAAQSALEGVLRTMKRLPRAEKVTVGHVVEGAFASVQSARANLNALEALLTVPPG